MSASFEVSVILPVYNGAEYIKRAVISAVQLQEVKEVIVVNDGSTDATQAVLETLCVSYPKVRAISLESNRGVSAARNIGMEQAGCAYLAFLDADDEYLPNRFAECSKVFEKVPDMGAVFEACTVSFDNDVLEREFVNEKHTLLHKPDITEEDSDDYFSFFVTKSKGLALLNGITLNQKYWQESKIFFDEKLRQTQDTDFLWQLSLKLKMSPGQMNEPVAVRHIHGKNRVLKNKMEARESYQLFIQKWYQKSLTASFPQKVNRYLLKQYAGHKINAQLPGLLIKIIVAANISKEVVTHPRHWRLWF